jgi:hypothetical protein
MQIQNPERFFLIGGRSRIVDIVDEEYPSCGLPRDRREQSGCQRDSGDIDLIGHHGRRQCRRNRLS